MRPDPDLLRSIGVAGPGGVVGLWGVDRSRCVNRGRCVDRRRNDHWWQYDADAAAPASATPPGVRRLRRRGDANCCQAEHRASRNHTPHAHAMACEKPHHRLHQVCLPPISLGGSGAAAVSRQYKFLSRAQQGMRRMNSGGVCPGFGEEHRRLIRRKIPAIFRQPKDQPAARATLTVMARRSGGFRVM
jgi:hypothetical protein